MDDAVGQPRQNVEDGVLMRRENAGEVGTVDNVLQGRQNADPDVRAVLIGDESAKY
jgi:hypothetical protein